MILNQGNDTLPGKIITFHIVTPYLKFCIYNRKKRSIIEGEKIKILILFIVPFGGMNWELVEMGRGGLLVI